MRNLPLVLVVCLSGCILRNLFQPPAPPQYDNSIVFPRFFEQEAVEIGAKDEPYELDGVTLRAITIAANDFLPIGAKNPPCENRQEAQRYRVIRRGDILFVYIYEDYEYCGNPMPLDSGAKYAISTDGRILQRIIDGQPEEPFGPVSPDAGDQWVPAKPGVPSGDAPVSPSTPDGRVGLRES
ncbi:hypothetical protein F0U60_50315 [Archangium minus]|uniref:Lipoprotein n=1 Tax=Archangium minus TaxID=83450 RepID=A0ABY9X7Q0_9BACT|nr:hypothetical protein F0U60_50315 [Archangium minus]